MRVLNPYLLLLAGLEKSRVPGLALLIVLREKRDNPAFFQKTGREGR